MEQDAAAERPAPQTQLQELRVKVDEVTEKMKNNVNKMVKAQLKADYLWKTAQNLNEGAESLKRTGEKLAWYYRCKNIKLIVLIVVIIAIIVLLIVLLAVGVIPVSAPVPAIVTPTSKP